LRSVQPLGQIGKGDPLIVDQHADGLDDPVVFLGVLGKTTPAHRRGEDALLTPAVDGVSADSELGGQFVDAVNGVFSELASIILKSSLGALLGCNQLFVGLVVLRAFFDIAVATGGDKILNHCLAPLTYWYDMIDVKVPKWVDRCGTVVTLPITCVPDIGAKTGYDAFAINCSGFGAGHERAVCGLLVKIPSYSVTVFLPIGGETFRSAGTRDVALLYPSVDGVNTDAKLRCKGCC
jgi:hypothetical protein